LELEDEDAEVVVVCDAVLKMVILVLDTTEPLVFGEDEGTLKESV
jgi:hypothetical protein